MVKVYKHFNKPYEFFWGLSLTKLIQIAVLTVIAVWSFFQLGLSPRSPLSLMLLIPMILFMALIIKSDDDFYLKLLWHPFEDHIYLINKKSNLYPCFNEKLSLKRIKDSIIYQKDNSITQVIEIKHGISVQNLSNDEKSSMLNLWAGFLSQYNQISNFDDYFSELLDKEHLEIFIYIDPESLEPSYYLVLHQDALNEDKSKLERLIVKLATKLGILTESNEYVYRKEYELLKEKLAYTKSYFNKLKLETYVLTDEKIKKLILKQVDIFDSKAKLHDKANHIEIENNKEHRFIKSYNLKIAPDSGDLDFWLQELILKINTKGFITIKFEYRDAQQDRKHAETKASLLAELKKSNRASTQSVIKDNLSISETLIEKPYSFNLSIGISVETKSLSELKDFDRSLKRPIKNCIWSSEERKQVDSFLANLISSRQSLSSYKHYADLDFARANFCFFASNFPKDSKYYVGQSLTDQSAINLNEDNCKLHKTRSINFIGDSGSGKSLLAKSMLIKRLGNPQNQFIIVDNTRDGWTDFCRALGGSVTDLNQVNNKEAYFNPFYLTKPLDIKARAQKVHSLLNFFTALSHQDTLSLEDKDFLGKSLNQFLAKYLGASLSDLYLFWSSWEQKDIANKWQNLISSYTHINNGAYAYLLDGKPQAYTNRLELFQFSTINQEKSFSDICFYLINTELESRALQENSKITLVIDEAWRLMQSSKAKSFLSYYARAGRAMDCALWTISQKPSDLGKEIYSSASLNVSFHLKEKADQENLKKLVGFEEHELALFRNNLLKARGNCIIKSTYGTDLVKVVIPDDELVLCSSQKVLASKRRVLSKGIHEYENTRIKHMA